MAFWETSPSAPIAASLARWVASPNVFENDLTDKARVLFVDAYLLALAAGTGESLGSEGWEAPLAKRFSAAVTAQTESVDASATIWGTQDRRAVGDAALINSYSTHARFQDDCEMSSWTHPGSFVVPSATAGVEYAGGTFGDALDAIVVGYAVTAWLGADGVVPRSLMRRGFRPTPVIAPVAAAVAFSRGAGLTAPQVEAAIEASSLLGRGTLQSVASGGDDWRFQSASATRDGVTACLAAQAGISSGSFGLDGPHGFVSTYCGLESKPPAWEHAPSASRIFDVWHKPYPTLGDNMGAVVAAEVASRRIRDSLQIHSVLIRMNSEFAAFPGVNAGPPWSSPMAALASVRFCVARVLHAGDLNVEDYTLFNDPAISELAKRIEIVPDVAMGYTEAELEIEVNSDRIVIGRGDISQKSFFRGEAEAKHAAETLLGEVGAEIAAIIFAAQDRVQLRELFFRIAAAASEIS